MSDGTKIEWTDTTWNPVTGCTKVSPGCANCYAERTAKWLKNMGSPRYRNGFAVTCHPKSLEEPDHWRRPRRVFVCSMGDLFHEDVPEEFIVRVFAAMERNPQHTYQILTKREHRMAELGVSLPWPDNVWAGVSIEDDMAVARIRLLSRVPARVRFISLEPLIGPVPSLLARRPHGQGPLDRVDWVIVGGESGRGCRTMPAGWPERIRDACIERAIPFFFKQWGDAFKTRGRLLEDQLWNQMPAFQGKGGDQ